MAFPYIFSSNFEQGTAAEWDSEQDTGSLLDFPHVSELARYPWSQAAPYRGAFCMRVKCGDTNDHTLREGDIDIADGATRHVRFYLYFAPDFTATADDTFNLFEFQQAGGTVEASFGARITAATGLIELGIGDGGAPTSFASTLIQRNRWYCIELELTVSTGGAGAFTLRIDGPSVVALTSQTHAAAVGSGDLGTQNTLSTTTGTILFDQFDMDDARLNPIVDRYPNTLLLTKSSHVFIGPGVLANVSLLSGTAADNVLTIYDTARGLTGDAAKVVIELKNVTQGDIVDPADMPKDINRGCYVQLSGTAPRAMVHVETAAGYGSTAVARRMGSRVKLRPLSL